MKKRNVFFVLVILLTFINLSGIVSSYQLNRTGIITNLSYERNFSHITISNPNLILYMPFDVQEDQFNKTYDYTNNSNDGTILNGAVFNSSGGKYGGGYTFDGVNNYINAGSGSTLDFGPSQNFTISFWTNLKGASGSYAGFVGKGGSASAGYFINLNNGASTLRYGISNGTQLIDTSGVVFTYNNWYHVVVVFNRNQNATVYINSTQKDTFNISHYVNETLVNFYPVYFGNFGGYFLNGSMDEVMIFNRSLTQTEIQQIYNETYSRFYSTGEMNFTSLNLSSQGDTNISFENCQTLNGSYIQGKLNSGNWKNFTNCSFNDSSFSGDLNSVNFSIRLISNQNFYSPLLIGPKGNPVNISELAIKINLTFPPTNSSPYYDYNNTEYGANSNPTGNPIGGFTDYNRIINPNDATYYVNNEFEFLDALRNVLSGETIYINDSITLDFTGYSTQIFNLTNITIASGRGTNYSSGALIKKDIKVYETYTDVMFKFSGSNIRITGLRFYGGDIDCNNEYLKAYTTYGTINSSTWNRIHPYNVGVWINGSNFEIDNSEFYGWRSAGIELYSGAQNTSVHHNYIHHNCHNGRGYGILIWDQSIALIEGNILNHNRHSVASDDLDNLYGNYNCSYEARYNIELGERIADMFNRHGVSDGISGAGNYTIIHHNSIYLASIDYFPGWPLISINSPPGPENGGQIYNNWIQKNTLDSSSITTLFVNLSYPSTPGAPGTNVTIFNNVLNSTRNPYVTEPVAVATSNATMVSINEIILFNASTSYKIGGSIRYIEWDFADNSSLVYGNTTTHSFSEAGRYKVKVTVSDEVGFLNWTYLNITVNPANSSKIYLNFWMFENSYVDSSEYVKKQAIVDGEVIWEQNFTDNVSEWKHINIEIPNNLTTDDLVNVTLGVKTIKNYTDPVYPNAHEVEFFEIYFDQISILSGQNDSVGFQGDLEAMGNWVEIDSETTPWTDELYWGRRINGQYAYKIAPLYRGNYTNGSFVGISNNFSITRLSLQNIQSPDSLTSPGGIITYRPSQNALEKGYSRTLKQNDKVEFTINNELKIAVVKNINSERKEVVVSISGSDYTINENSSVKIDTNNDGYYDTEILVNRIMGNNYANIEFKSINEEIPKQEQEQQESPAKEETSEIEEKKKCKWYWYLIGGIIVLLVVLWIIFRKISVKNFEKRFGKKWKNS